MTTWFLACLAWLFSNAPSLHAQSRIALQLDTSETDAVLAIVARRAAGEPMRESDWQRLFATEPYRRLKMREAGMKRSFEDADFRQFVLSADLLKRSNELERTLAVWKKIDLEAAARRVLPYLPAEARIRAKVFPVIKPQSNSFVFDVSTDPAIFLFLDPEVTAEKFANTVAHELHHIGFASVRGEGDDALKALPPRAKTAAEWMGAFGEGMAMSAAAGGPDVHPHASSSPEDRARWDEDIAKFDSDVELVERFFLDVIDGGLASEDQIRERPLSFYGVQGPWYTVGWKMAIEVERRYGREALIECMADPRRLLATFNRAVMSQPQRDLRLWSARLLEAVGARPATAVGVR